MGKISRRTWLEFSIFTLLYTSVCLLLDTISRIFRLPSELQVSNMDNNTPTIPTPTNDSEEAKEMIRDGNPEGLFLLYDNLISRVAEQYYIDSNLMKSLFFFESGFQPTAVSRKGAIGIGQVMPFHGPNLDLTDPLTNIIVSAQILSDYHRGRSSTLEDWKLTFMDYNGGPNRKSTSQNTIDYANNILTLFQDHNALLYFIQQKGNGRWAMLYWHLSPINPLEQFERVGADFREPSYYQPDGHTGWDLKTELEKPIYAVASGKVIFKGWLEGTPGTNTGYGNTIVLQHNDNISDMNLPSSPVYTLYAHMVEFGDGIEVNNQINQGSVLGYVGSTGASSTPHLHFEVIEGGYIDSNLRQISGDYSHRHPLWLLPLGQEYPGRVKLSLS